MNINDFLLGCSAGQSGGGGIEEVEWHQCPEAVREYLENVVYDPSDYTVSHISEYAPATAVQSNTKPVGTTVDGVTYYNEVPLVKTPFASTNKAGTVKPLDRLRWLNTGTENVRDLGGWNCDGGTVKYGMLIRGGEPSSADRNLMVDDVGIKVELSLRGLEVPVYTESKWSGCQFYRWDRYAWYTIQDRLLWKEMLRALFDSILYNKPTYFHCAAGQDRTATFACVIEALLGMSQSDIDKDYELSNFYSGTESDITSRRRNETEWTGLIGEIKAVPLVGGLADTFRNRAVSFVLSLGFTIDEVNAFRSAMIDGTPSVITVSLDEYTVTKSGANVTYDNSISSVEEYQGYSVNITPNAGYLISGVTVTMDGVDITSWAFDGDFTVNGKLEITSNDTYDVSNYEAVEVNVNPTQRTVAKTLSNSTISNAQTQVINGQSYGAVITPNDGYAITSIQVKMGGVDVSSSVLTMIGE